MSSEFLRTAPPTVSICVVTYNQEKYIRRCLQSLVDQQADFGYEIIVSDDCSTDRTPDIIREFSQRYPDQITPIFHPRNLGASRNYLYAHAAATGDYVAHLDGDDMALAGKLLAQVRYLAAHSECSAVVHALDVVDADGVSMGRRWPAVFTSDSFDFASLAIHHPGFGHSSLMYRKGGLAAIIATPPTEILDFYIYLHLVAQGRIGVLHDALGLYTAGVGVSTGLSLHGLVIESLQYAQRLGLSPHVVKFAMARQYLLFANRAVVEGKDDLFRELISKSVACRVISPVQLLSYLGRGMPGRVRDGYRLLQNFRKFRPGRPD